MTAGELRSRAEGSEWRVARVIMLRAPGHAERPIVDLPLMADPAAVTRPPVIDDDGLLWHRGRWVAIPHAQIPLVRILLDRFQSTVPDADLRAAYQPGSPSSPRALAGALNRLGKRVVGCGLAVSRVRNRGYILDRSRVDFIIASESDV